MGVLVLLQSRGNVLMESCRANEIRRTYCFGGGEQSSHRGLALMGGLGRRAGVTEARPCLRSCSHTWTWCPGAVQCHVSSGGVGSRKALFCPRVRSARLAQTAAEGDLTSFSWFGAEAGEERSVSSSGSSL